MRGKKRAPGDRTSSVAGPLPPCRVCGEEGAGFHYGVNTCEACKGFFRRSLLRKGDYSCLESGNCNVQVNRRKSCPKCRYLKCLEVGMSKEAIKTGRYTYMKRTSDFEEVQQLITQGKISAETLEKPTTTATRLSVVQSLSTSCSKASSAVSTTPVEWDDMCKASSVPTRTSSSLSEFVISPVTCLCIEENDIMVEGGTPPESLSRHTKRQTIALNHPTLKKEIQSKFDNLEIDNCYASSEHPHPKTKYKINSHKDQNGLPSTTSETTISETAPVSPLIRLLENNEVDNGDSSNSVALYDSSSSKSSCNVTRCNKIVSPYSVQELDDAVEFVTNVHRKYASDFIDEPDEVLHERFEKCFRDCKLKEKIFGEMRTIEREDYEHVLQVTGIDVDGRLSQLTDCISHIEDEVKILVQLCKALPEFRRLSLLNQQALLKGSSLVLLFIGFYKGYDSKKKMLICRHKSFCSHDLAMWGEEHVKLMDIVFNVADELKARAMTYAMHVCLKMISLFNPDYVSGDDKDMVRELNSKYHECLKLLFRRADPSKDSQQVNQDIQDIIWMLRFTVTFHCQQVRQMDFLSYRPVNENKIYLELLDF